MGTSTAYGGPFLDDVDHVRFGRRKILVSAVTVGGLDDEDVGFLDGCRVAQDGASRLAQIAAEHDLRGVTVLGNPHFHDG